LGAAARCPGSVAVSSRPGAVVEVNHAVAETAFVQQFELQEGTVGKGLFAASHHDGRDDQMAIVDQQPARWPPWDRRDQGYRRSIRLAFKQTKGATVFHVLED